ncbi:MAG TPA: hypothetical protein VF637_01070, partial [Sphingomicrobium sp.]
MADTPFLTVDRTEAPVALPTAKLIDDTLRELFGLAVAQPGANTIGARIVAMVAALGAAADADTASTIIGLLKNAKASLAGILTEMQSNTPAAVTQSGTWAVNLGTIGL